MTNRHTYQSTDDRPFIHGTRARLGALLARGIQWALFLLVAGWWLQADGASTAVEGNAYALQALAAASVVVCIEVLVTRPLRRRCR